MNAINRSEELESTEADTDLAAVSEVEAGIRDFVRNDIAYLRRPAPVRRQRRAARYQPRHRRQQRQLADPARRRHFACRNRKADRRARGPARPAACRGPARPARDFRLCPAQPGRDEIHPHDRRQCFAVETRRRRPAQRLADRSFSTSSRRLPSLGSAAVLLRSGRKLGKKSHLNLLAVRPRPRAGRLTRAANSGKHRHGKHPAGR